MKISFNWFFCLILIMVFAFLINAVSKKISLQKLNWEQFECGFQSMTPTHIPFSFQFFLVALLFLMFDIEIALVISYPLESLNQKNMILIFLFVVVLSLGLFYEWKSSKVDWTNWMGKNFFASKSSL